MERLGTPRPAALRRPRLRCKVVGQVSCISRLNPPGCSTATRQTSGSPQVPRQKDTSESRQGALLPPCDRLLLVVDRAATSQPRPWIGERTWCLRWGTVRACWTSSSSGLWIRVLSLTRAPLQLSGQTEFHARLGRSEQRSHPRALQGRKWLQQTSWRAEQAMSISFQSAPRSSSRPQV